MAGIRDTRADRVFGAVNMGLLTVLVLLVLYPLIYVVSCSVSDPSAVGAGEVILLPKGFTLMGYRRVFQEDAILTGYGNTLLYTVVGTAITWRDGARGLRALAQGTAFSPDDYDVFPLYHVFFRRAGAHVLAGEQPGTV